MRPPRRSAARVTCAVIIALAAIPLLATGSDAGGATLSLSAEPVPDGIEATATVTDPQGRAVSGAEIVFLRRTTFGWLEVARMTTGADGTVRAVLGLPRGAVHEIKAIAEGEDYTVQRVLRLDPSVEGGPRIRPGEVALEALSPQPGFISPYPPARLLVTLLPVLLGVWITYTVVAYQLYGIARNH